MLEHGKDNASSLLCLRDSTTVDNSWRSSWSSSHGSFQTSSSHLSREFEFDLEVQNSRVYQLHLRKILRQSFRNYNKRHQIHGEQLTETHGSLNSVLDADAKDLSDEGSNDESDTNVDFEELPKIYRHQDVRSQLQFLDGQGVDAVQR